MHTILKPRITGEKADHEMGAKQNKGFAKRPKAVETVHFVRLERARMAERSEDIGR
jgi:hypothetical protein